MGKMICSAKARAACPLAYMCEENAEVDNQSECADFILNMEILALQTAEAGKS